jgi:hypothetical protein
VFLLVAGLAPPWIWWWGALPVHRGSETFCDFSDPSTDDDKGQLTLLVHEPKSRSWNIT